MFLKPVEMLRLADRMEFLCTGSCAAFTAGNLTKKEAKSTHFRHRTVEAMTRHLIKLYIQVDTQSPSYNIIHCHQDVNY